MFSAVISSCHYLLNTRMMHDIIHSPRDTVTHKITSLRQVKSQITLVPFVMDLYALCMFLFDEGVKRPWIDTERAAVEKHLSLSMLRGQLPGKSAIEECLAAEPCLAHRTWRNVKDYCRCKMKK